MGKEIVGRRLLVLCLVSTTLCAVIDKASASGDPVFDSQLSAALQKSLEKAREVLKTDNVSASLYISDRCYWEGASGVTRQDPAVPVDSDTIYAFGSITKTFVAGIVLQLAEENRLALDDPLGNWLPKLPHIDQNISVRQLLNHGSGFSGYYRSKRYRAELEANPDRVWQPGETLQFGRPPRSADANPQNYSNTNYILLGLIIEAITGNSLSQELQNRVIDPLDLNSTYLPVDSFKPGQWADSTRLSIARFSSTWAAGAIASVPRDIAKWTQTLHSGDFLRPATLEAMRITYPRRIQGNNIPMGLGVWKLEGKKFIAWGHGGSFEPFLSATYYIPELRISVAHSFIADRGEQLLPGTFLVNTYLENQPPDISVCFD